MPARSEVSDVINAQAAARGRVIDRLQPGDVVVVDLFGKIADGTFGGDNLHSAIYTGTRTGFVIDGSIRDLGGVIQLDAAGYFRGSTPTTTPTCSPGSTSRHAYSTPSDPVLKTVCKV